MGCQTVALFSRMHIITISGVQCDRGVRAPRYPMLSPCDTNFLVVIHLVSIKIQLLGAVLAA